jgi:hypothetical protein
VSSAANGASSSRTLGSLASAREARALGHTAGYLPRVVVAEFV